MQPRGIGSEENRRLMGRKKGIVSGAISFFRQMLGGRSWGYGTDRILEKRKGQRAYFFPGFTSGNSDVARKGKASPQGKPS